MKFGPSTCHFSLVRAGMKVRKSFHPTTATELLPSNDIWPFGESQIRFRETMSHHTVKEDICMHVYVEKNTKYTHLRNSFGIILFT